MTGRPNLSDISGKECAAAVVAGFSVLIVLHQGSSDQITEKTLYYRSISIATVSTIRTSTTLNNLSIRVVNTITADLVLVTFTFIGVIGTASIVTPLSARIINRICTFGWAYGKITGRSTRSITVTASCTVRITCARLCSACMRNRCRLK